MKSVIMRITLFTILLYILFISSAHGATERRTASVIGNSNYTAGILRNPVNDVGDLASALKRLGFDVKQPLQVVEKKELAMGPRPSPSTSNEIKRDGRFIAYDNGTVLDTRTNRMWAAKDNGANIYWADAKRYCENYRGSGFTDWRMPTQDELAALYDVGKTYNSSCGYDVHLTELIHLSCIWAWASETRGSEAAYFHFSVGYRNWSPQFYDDNPRALPVRNAK